MPDGRLLQHFDISQLNLKRKALVYSSQGNDHLALLAEIRHSSLNTFKDS
jgi:hypothetical protein